MGLFENVQRVRGDIAALAPDRSVTLVAVTKTRTAQQINPLWELGVRDIGENRVQEWTGKQDQVLAQFRLHQIGQLQTNKVKYLLPRVELVHSVDRAALVDQISVLAQRQALCVRILLQVNTAREPQKGGVAPEQLMALADHAAQSPGVRLCGLMCVAPLNDDAQLSGAQAAFCQAREWFDRLKSQYGPAFDTLSMGMSRDYRIALSCGSTMIRVGTSLFR